MVHGHMSYICRIIVIFFFNETATTEIYPLSLHYALPISGAEEPRDHPRPSPQGRRQRQGRPGHRLDGPGPRARPRSEEHTSELQSQSNLVCRLLLEKKNYKPDTVSSIPHILHLHTRSMYR